ncbi:hypothetical protein H4Q32_018036 [Labeo rohita]|uniref:Uncharacterized protein n=1 Tax=Labeo rohita TaxID=84645 RepID=A0ABQ8LY91_LABRO|nr:hypothetical protein H4Q32_018036 [Labeo rohita]
MTLSQIWPVTFSPLTTRCNPSHSIDIHITLTIAPHPGLPESRKYLATPGSSSFLHELCIEIFCDSINQPLSTVIRHEGPRSSFAQILDYALLIVGSLFTVGVAEEERNIATMPVMAAATLSQPGTPGLSSIMIATPVLKPASEMVAAPERAHVMMTTAEHVHKMAAKTVLHQVRAVIPEPGKVNAVVPVSSQVTAVVPESSQVTADLHKSSKATADLQESGPATADVHQPSQSLVTPRLTVQSLVTSRLTTQSLVTPCLSSQSLVTSRLTIQSLGTPRLTSQSLITSKPRHVSSDTPRSQLIMMASVLDPPLMSVRALPLMAVTILCVWAAHSAPEVSSLHESAPEVSSFHESAPVPPEVAAPAAEPPKGAPSICELSTCPLTTLEAICELMEALYELSACPVTAMKAICELPPGPEPATEAVNELSALPATAKNLSSERPVPAMEAMNEFYAHSVTAIEAVIELSAPSVSAKDMLTRPTVSPASLFAALSASPVPISPRSQSMPWVSVPSWRPSAPPWWAPSHKGQFFEFETYTSPES